MKRRIAVVRSMGCVMLAGGLLLGAGCETDDSPDTEGVGSYFDRNPYTSDSRTPMGAPLEVSTTDAVLETDGGKAVVTAVGGTPPYRWGVSDVTRGNVNASTGSGVVYTRNHAGDNAVGCEDAAGTVAYVVIRQP